MPTYEIIARTLTFNKPGLSPTEKNGTDMGYVSSGTFTPTREVNGWLDMTPNRWIMKSACKVVTVTPPPPPVEPPPAELERMIIQYSNDNGVTWITDADEIWERVS
jgi:hypothetical protein